jgi:hypothetical protein
MRHLPVDDLNGLATFTEHSTLALTSTDPVR